jgi:hypothetical protein
MYRIKNRELQKMNIGREHNIRETWNRQENKTNMRQKRKDRKHGSVIGARKCHVIDYCSVQVPSHATNMQDELVEHLQVQINEASTTTRNNIYMWSPSPFAN